MSRPARAWQRMLSGRRLDLIDPSPLDIEIEDIAHGLAFVARWNGQTTGEFPYSVAEHSLLVEAVFGALSPRTEPRWRLAALLHDAPEYVIGDMISPVKAAVGPGYAALDARLTAAVHLRFGLPADLPGARQGADQAGGPDFGLARGDPDRGLLASRGRPVLRQAEDHGPGDDPPAPAPARRGQGGISDPPRRPYRLAALPSERGRWLWTEAAHPVHWAGTQNNLGAAKRAQGARLGGAAGAALLGEAVAAYGAALRVRTEAAHPVDWAGTQNNLGAALAAQGERLGGAAGAALLGEAAAAFRAVLRVRTEAAHPVDWAGTMENLGNARVALADNPGCADPQAALAEAAACFEAALRVFDPVHTAFNHAKASAALARVRAKLAARAGI